MTLVAGVGTLQDVAWAAGPVVGIGWLLGSVPIGTLVRRARVWRDLRRLDHGVPSTGRALGRGQAGLTVEAVGGSLLCLAAATLAWHVVADLAPPATVSSVAALSAQAITAWQSVALWAGAAALLGHVASPWARGQGGTGLAPAMALLFAYTPLLFATAFAAWAATTALTRRHLVGVGVGLATVIAVAWQAWVHDWPPAWGTLHGPEISLWATAMAAIVGARNLGPLLQRPGQ